MNKNEEDKIVNAIIGLHEEIQIVKRQGEKSEKQMAKINLAIGELRLSYIKLDEKVTKLDQKVAKLDQKVTDLDDSFNKYAKSNDAILKKHETRLARLEENASGGSYITRESVVKYKGKRK